MTGKTNYCKCTKFYTIENFENKQPKNYILSTRIGVIVIGDDNGKRSRKENIFFAKRQSSRMERKGIYSIVLEESKWNTLKSYEKSLVFYTKIVHMMEIYRKKKLNQLGKEF